MDDHATLMAIFAKSRLRIVMRRCSTSIASEMMELLGTLTPLRRRILLKKGPETSECKGIWFCIWNYQLLWLVLQKDDVRREGYVWCGLRREASEAKLISGGRQGRPEKGRLSFLLIVCCSLAQLIKSSRSFSLYRGSRGHGLIGLAGICQRPLRHANSWRLYSTVDHGKNNELTLVRWQCKPGEITDFAVLH